MRPPGGILIALDSVGIDPLGHDRPESTYAESAFLFPRGRRGSLLEIDGAPRPGALVETDVTQGLEVGAIECALTYTAHMTGISAVERHGLMQGLGLEDTLLEALVRERNLFSCFESPCLASAVFPVHLPFFRSGYVEGLPEFGKAQVEEGVRWRGEPVRLTGSDKRGFAELFTLAEINQNIFVYAAQEAGVRLCTHDDVRAGRALTTSLTHELEAEFDLAALGIEPLPPRTPEEAGGVLARLAESHDFVFAKYQIPDLVSHTGRLDLARGVVSTIERFVAALLEETNAFVVITSDHGHLEQVAYTQGHPKTRVPTWVFGPEALRLAAGLRTPEAIFHLLAGTS